MSEEEPSASRNPSNEGGSDALTSHIRAMQRLGWGAGRTAAAIRQALPLYLASQRGVEAFHVSRLSSSSLLQSLPDNKAEAAYLKDGQGSSFDRDVNLIDKFFGFLNSESASTAHRIPHHYSRLDAYLHLKEHAPHLLSQLSDDSLNRLCSTASIQGLGSVLISLLDDLEGVTLDEEDFFFSKSFDDTEMASLDKLRQTSGIKTGGVLGAAPGSKRRILALQHLIMGASHRKAQSHVVAGEKAEEEQDMFPNIDRVEKRLSVVELQRAFKMLLEDMETFRKRNSSTSGGSDSSFPSSLIDKTARRLIRTIAIGGIHSSDQLLARLIQHVKSHDDWPFPTLAEGWQLLDYFLGMEKGQTVSNLEVYTSQPASPDIDMPEPLAAARGIITQLASAYPEFVSDHVLQQVSREGQIYREYLVSQGCAEEVAADTSVRHSLRSVIVHAVLKPGKEEVLQSQIKLLVEEMQLTASFHKVKPPLWILAPLVRSGISLRLGAQRDAGKALPMALRFSNVWMQGSDAEESGRVLQSLCQWAIDQEKPQLATDLILNILDGQQNTVIRGLRPEAHIVGGATIVRLLENARSNSRGDIVAVLMQRLGIIDGRGIVGDSTIDQIFTDPFRAKLITLLARSGLKRQSRTLYERWGAPFRGEVRAQDVQAHLMEMMLPLRKNRLSANEQNATVTNDITASVTGSPDCLYHLVRLFCGTRLNDESLIDSDLLSIAAEKGEDELTLQYHAQFAYHVLFRFFSIHKYTRALDRGTFVTLAKTYLRLGHRNVAFKCLSDTVVAHSTAELREATTLMRLMGAIDIEEACEYLVNAMSRWIKRHEGGKEELAGMYSVLIETAFRQHRLDLAQNLLQSAVSNELHHYADIVSMGTLVKLALGDQPSRKEILESQLSLTSEELLNSSKGSSEKVFFTRWIQERMEKYFWKPDPKFLTWMISVVIRKGSLSDPPREAEAAEETVSAGEEKTVRESNRVPVTYTLNERERRSGITLLALCSKHLSYLDLTAATDVIRSIQNAAYHLRQSKRKDQGLIVHLAEELDQVAALLRWTLGINSGGYVLPIEGVGKLPAASAPGVLTERPNRLPPRIFRSLITSYLRIGDMIGAASVVAWARDDAHYSLEELGKGWKNTNGRSFKNTIKDVIYRSHRPQGTAQRETIINWFAGAQPVPKTKSWWSRPE